MIRSSVGAILMLLLLCGARGLAQSPVEAPAVIVSAGMGVNYLQASDIADLASVTGGTKVDAFTSAAEFFADATVPVAERWWVGGGYAYLVGGYSAGSGYGGGEYSFAAHLPSALVYYGLVEEPTHALRAGAGLGYHFASVTSDIPGASDTYSGSGPGVLLDFRANTALGDGLFALLGVHLRWDAIGTLTNDAGLGIPTRAGLPPPTFTFFSAAAKLGVTYHF